MAVAVINVKGKGKAVGAKVQAVETRIEAFPKAKVKVKAEVNDVEVMIVAVKHHFQEKEDVGTGIKSQISSNN